MTQWVVVNHHHHPPPQSETLCPHRVAQLSVTASAHKSINGNAMTSFRAVVAAATASGQARNPCRVTVSSDRPPGLVIRQRFSSNPLNGSSCERESVRASNASRSVILNGATSKVSSVMLSREHNSTQLFVRERAGTTSKRQEEPHTKASQR